ncbi:FCF1 family protein [Cavenderia fasciculata]|uniref:FCF1 family protein n=1 Tax=Cavenderia fasciculata TaxID=261658 RepID=F4PPQ8_CACFS|nr:FCF1 family protein [Cavenderia fasciculata]EGG22371.1 FCF1 family protein [Cavenderia fasciculata]|eukprot:XP_004360222.1 FCF1 family protein [Cavenderia fasciculata]
MKPIYLILILICVSVYGIDINVGNNNNNYKEVIEIQVDRVQVLSTSVTINFTSNCPTFMQASVWGYTCQPTKRINEIQCTGLEPGTTQAYLVLSQCGSSFFNTFLNLKTFPAVGNPAISFKVLDSTSFQVSHRAIGGAPYQSTYNVTVRGENNGFEKKIENTYSSDQVIRVPPKSSPSSSCTYIVTVTVYNDYITNTSVDSIKLQQTNRDKQLAREKEKQVFQKKIDSVPDDTAHHMFFSYNEALVPPYYVILDTNFINFSCSLKIDIVEGLMDCLYAKCIPCLTDCCAAELERLGPKFRVALKISKDPRIQRLPCFHKGTYADDCIINRITMHRMYLVATCDADLRRRIRKIPGVPLIYPKGKRYTIERLPDAPGAK